MRNINQLLAKQLLLKEIFYNACFLLITDSDAQLLDSWEVLKAKGGALMTRWCNAQRPDTKEERGERRMGDGGEDATGRVRREARGKH